MTKEEREYAINFLKGYLDEDVYTEKCINAHTMAIKSLEQEPCEDAISRQAAIDALTKTSGIRGDALKALYDLPSVTPQPKIGHWKRISIDKYVQHAMAYYKCSVCDKDIIGTHNYCPNCGAKIEREVEE